MQSVSRTLVRPRIATVFESCRARRRAAFIPFFVAGDPTSALSLAAIGAAIEAGADLLELGFPYDDPLADGPTIQRASRRARTGATDFSAVLALASECVARHPSVPLIAFTYYNPLFVRGLARSVSELVQAGFSGLIVPDLPWDEAAELAALCSRHALALSLLVAPSTTAERATMIASASSDFVYVVSRVGITGAERNVGDGVARRLAELRRLTTKPLAVGFGIDSPATAAQVAHHADGVVVGSAIIDRMEAAGSGEELVRAVYELCSRFAQACARAD